MAINKFLYNVLSGKFDLVRDLSLYATIEYVNSQISNEAYGATWDNVTDVAPSKNTIYDKIATLITGVGTSKITVSATEPVAPAEGDIWIQV